MSSTIALVKDLKESLSKELNLGQSSDSERCSDIIEQLDTLPINLNVLTETLVGTVVSKFKSYGDPSVAAKAKALVKKWKQLAKNGGVSSGSTNPVKSPPPSRSASMKRASSLSKTKTAGKANPTMATAKTNAASAPTDDASANWSHLPQVRQNTAKKLHQTFETSMESLAKSGIHQDAIKDLTKSRAVEIEAACHSVAKGMKKNYLEKIRSLIFNLRKNQDLRDDVVLGKISSETLVTLPPEQLLSKEKSKERTEIVAKLKDSSRLDWEESNEDKINEMCGIKGELLKASLFTCGRCKSIKTTSTQKQTRSADEPMTVFVLCLNCGNRWKC